MTRPPQSSEAVERGKARVFRLLHDVGKYISRTAVNLRDVDSVPSPMLGLLVVDLYHLEGSKRASKVFEEHATAVEALLGKVAHLDACREKLQRIDALEGDVRAGVPGAVSEAATLAVAISRTLMEMRTSLFPESHG